MNIKVREYLIEVARKRTDQIVTYQKLCDDCDLKLNMYNNPNDRTEIGKILDDISVYEYENNRPLLSSLVVRISDKEEGDGFYRLCQRLGYGEAKKLKADCTFSVKHMNRCIEFWSNEGKYKANINIE